MKKAIKIILPLFLVLVLLVVGYWFFFQARTDLTAQGLIRLGDWLETGQHYRLAINSFSMANKLQPQDADLALKLAQAYRNSSNFTQTERTLVNAIYASPDDTRLYVALSKVYVEQDKLMDAQQMLDNIANPTVLAELSSRRPLAPTISPEGGYYSEYITVSLEPGDDAACYFTTDGQYPSLARDLYSAPVELPGGETKVCAVAVDDEGLVSPAIYVGYTVAGVVEDVTFADPTLEHYVQELLHRGSRKLQTDDLWSITELELPEGLTTLEDLQYFTGLTRITGHDLAEMDFSPLASMPDLKVLELNRCALTSENLEVIGACGNLERLKLTSCGLSNITALGQLTALKTLDLWDNSINSIAALTTCGNLEELYVGQNALTTLPPMAGLKNLRILDLSYNALESVTPLSVCSEIRELYVEHNKLIALTAIGALRALQRMDASNNQVEDASPLAGCTNLVSFVMTDNKLTNVDFLANAKALEEINIDYNDVQAVPPFTTDCALVKFSAAHNFLNDLSGLAGLEHLTYVNADYNNITDIAVLSDCPVLAQVNVYGTYIRDDGVLGDKGVVVNFTPGFD